MTEKYKYYSYSSSLPESSNSIVGAAFLFLFFLHFLFKDLAPKTHRNHEHVHHILSVLSVVHHLQMDICMKSICGGGVDESPVDAILALGVPLGACRL